jgi:phage terminase small subunit
LNSQQKQFADEYLIDLNATQAAIRAGYSIQSARSQASQLLDNEEIAGYIGEKQKAASDKLNWSFEKLIISFGEIHSRCMQGEQVLDFEGKPTGEWKFEPNAAVKSLENIGKHLGFYERNNTITVKQEQPLFGDGK